MNTKSNEEIAYSKLEEASKLIQEVYRMDIDLDWELSEDEGNTLLQAAYNIKGLIGMVIEN